MRSVRHLLVAGYATVALVALWSPAVPRVFWTMLMPLVPVAVVALGFAWWRRACPVAFVASLGARLAARRRRLPRVPPVVQRFAPAIGLAVLVACLVVRHVATNGDGVALGTFLLALPLVAVAVNALLGGRAFCHYVCPVGVVERIYTDGDGREGRSPCARCTGCKSACADLDRERAHQADLGEAPRRLATFSFPGIVFGFYFYYFLRHGEWEAFFDGRWTVEPAGADLVLGPGITFAPQVPVVLAASATLLVCGAASYAIFASIERALGSLRLDRALLRQRLLAVASFAAFSIFYCFAGAPALRVIPGAARVTAIAVTVVAALVLVRRWDRPPLRRLPVVR